MPTALQIKETVVLSCT